jgi:hypothetical protein
MSELIPFNRHDLVKGDAHLVDARDEIWTSWREVCQICGEEHERVSRDRCPARAYPSRLVTIGRQPSPLGHVVEDLVEGAIEDIFGSRRRKRR